MGETVNAGLYRLNICVLSFFWKTDLSPLVLSKLYFLNLNLLKNISFYNKVGLVHLFHLMYFQ